MTGLNDAAPLEDELKRVGADLPLSAASDKLVAMHRGLGMQTEEQARSLLEGPLDYPGLVQRRGAFGSGRAPAFDPEAAWAIITDQASWLVRRVVHARQQRGGEIFHDTLDPKGACRNVMRSRWSMN